MNFKKTAITVAALVTLAVGTQSAYANTNVYERHDIQNDDYYQPEKFIYPDPNLDNITNPFGVTKVGTLRNTTDNDWYLLEIPQDTIGTGSTATITLIGPSGGYRYGLSVSTDDGMPVPKEWLIDDGQVTQVRIYTVADTKYRLHVSLDGSSVSTSPYMLGVN
ncbi:hypothetical protein BC351_03975 [Paenibacillus ferrarius]|uniref:PLAT domain-containing protein n=1 Tax=Paenibacillus ferrarius TaxID=1469647 RepID=A0A1V4HKA2_9BACL|nr:hypothetical protein [Paenibacillus ferrarius]OPH57681.1 hypothetical protein BC351_03975 [Paenibacillus ferrarius]